MDHKNSFLQIVPNYSLTVKMPGESISFKATYNFSRHQLLNTKCVIW